MLESLELVPAASPNLWGRWLDPLPHDFYHTASYHRFAEESGEGRAFLAVFGSPDRYLAWPYLLRPIDQDPSLFDVTSVYGYAGPLASGAVDRAFLARAHQVLADLWRSQGAISAFTRFHPLLDNHRWADAAGLVRGGETVSIDLTAPDPASLYRSDLRQGLRRARRAGLETRLDPHWRHLDDFVALYHAAMARNHAAPFYYFSAAVLRRLRDSLGDHARLILTTLGGEVAAAAILVEYRGAVHYHLSATADGLARLAPCKVLLDDARRWTQARGNRVLHLGGGRGAAGDSLFAFKSRFSPRRHVFYTGRWVLDRVAYEELMRGRGAHDFFPAYRVPLAAAAGSTPAPEMR